MSSSSDIAQAFNTNAALGDPSALSQPGMTNHKPSSSTQGARMFSNKTDAMGEKLSRYYYEQGVKAAEAAFAPVKPPSAPAAPKTPNAGAVTQHKALGAAQRNPGAPGSSAPVSTAPIMPAPISPAMTAQAGMAQRLNTAVQFGAKAAGFNFGLTAPPKSSDNGIEPDNGSSSTSINYDNTELKRQVAEAFNSLNSAPHNADFVTEAPI